MSLFCKAKIGLNTFWGDTIGQVWHLAGVVDPWTKQAIICCNAQAMNKASGGTISRCTTQQTTDQGVTQQLKANCADPSQLACGIKKSFCQLKNDLTSTVVIVIVLAIIAIILVNMLTARR